METKESQESLQSRLSFLHLGRLFSSDRDDSRDSDDYLETGLERQNTAKRREKPRFPLLFRRSEREKPLAARVQQRQHEVLEVHLNNFSKASPSIHVTEASIPCDRML